MSDFVKQTTEYKVRKAKRKRWQKIVSVMASIVVFCTVYALILPAITWNRKGDLLLNGNEINNSYEWSDESGLVSLDVELYGEILFEGELDPEAEPVLDVEINSDEDIEKFTEYAQERDAIPYATFRLHMTVGEVELDLSDCVADIKMNVDKEQLLAATPMSIDAADTANDAPLTWEDTTLVEITDGVSELDAVELSGEDSVLTYSVYANSPVALTSVISNPSYTLQHYLWFDQVVTTSTSNGSPLDFPFINTSSMPTPSSISNENKGKKQNVGLKNGMTAATNNTAFGAEANKIYLLYVELVEQSGYTVDGRTPYRLKTQHELTKIFEDFDATYREHPQIEYMNEFYRAYGEASGEFGSNYTLSEVWIGKPGTDPESTDKNDFCVYTVPVSSETDPNDVTNTYHDPKKIRFTNNPTNPYLSLKNGQIFDTSEDNYPYTYTILVEDNSIIRLVFDITTGSRENEANFFDYDVTDGYIYEINGTKHNTSEQTNTEVWYAKTEKQGINSTAGYTQGNGSAHYAFGNANINMAWENEQLQGYNINQANKASYNNLSFGLVQGLDHSDSTLPVPVWNNDITAPDIFSEKNATGKTVYTNKANTGTDAYYNLKFDREGGTYILDSIIKKNSDSTSETAVANLRDFTEVYRAEGKTIYSNEFWPMDNSESYGTDGHDLKFGSYLYVDNRKTLPGQNPFPIADIANPGRNSNWQVMEDLYPAKSPTVDHNAFLGMSYTVEFTVHPGYCAPLAYWFYGDDDMWVFLEKKNADGNYSDSKLVADIGGVHSSIGEYVNLWDYVAPVDYGNDAESYRLTIFFTERGASGSSCFMRLTVPMNVTVEDPPDRTEALVFEKVLLDSEGNEVPLGSADNHLFEFTLTMKTSDGADYGDIYDYTIYSRADAPNHNTATPRKEGVLGVLSDIQGEYLFELYGGEYIVISNLPPGTHYTIEERGSNNDGYVTSYQVGTHKHDDSGGAVDTLGNAVHYSYVAGQSPLLDGAEYNYVLFTNSPALKTEVTPGEDAVIKVGDELIYRIDWGNNQGAAADVTVTDALDPGLDFVAAKFSDSGDTDGDWLLTAGSGSLSYSDDNERSITYDQATNTIEWNMTRDQQKTSDFVILKVRVNENARIVDKITNKADIQVGNQHITTDVTVNPVWTPVKTEPSPGENKEVMPRDSVTYRISWKNYMREPAAILIKDFLDPDVTFELSNSAVYRYDENRDPVPINPIDTFFADRTVQWRLDAQPPDAEGYVELTVTVKAEAVTKGKIDNQGSVTVGTDIEQYTNIVSNPIYGYELPSTGGVGTVIFTVVGLTLMASSIVAGCVIRRKERRQSKKVSRR